MLDEIKAKKRTGFRKLTSIAQLRGGSDLDFDHDEHDEDEPTGVAVDLIPDAMIEDRMASVAGYRERNGYCLVIEAPSADMVGLLCHSLQQTADWTGWISRTMPLKGKEDDQVGRLVRSLANGGRIFAISQDPARLLPPELMSLADDVIKIPAPGRAVMASVIKAVTGQLPVDLPEDLRLCTIRPTDRQLA